MFKILLFLFLLSCDNEKSGSTTENENDGVEIPLNNQQDKNKFPENRPSNISSQTIYNNNKGENRPSNISSQTIYNNNKGEISFLGNKTPKSEKAKIKEAFLFDQSIRNTDNLFESIDLLFEEQNEILSELKNKDRIEEQKLKDFASSTHFTLGWYRLLIENVRKLTNETKNILFNQIANIYGKYKSKGKEEVILPYFKYLFEILNCNENIKKEALLWKDVYYNGKFDPVDETAVNSLLFNIIHGNINVPNVPKKEDFNNYNQYKSQQSSKLNTSENKNLAKELLSKLDKIPVPKLEDLIEIVPGISYGKPK